MMAKVTRYIKEIMMCFGMEERGNNRICKFGPSSSIFYNKNYLFCPDLKKYKLDYR